MKDWKTHLSPSGTEPLKVVDAMWLGDKVKVTGEQLDSKLRYTRTLKSVYEYNEESEMTKTNTLYQIKGTETYGTYLATNSEGKFVLEMKGSTELKTVNKNEVEEVLPHTVEISFGSDSRGYAFFCDKGKLEVGDIIMRMDSSYKGTIGFVTAIDTKSKAATKELVAVKLTSEKI